MSGYGAVLVTLPVAATNYRMLTLIQAMPGYAQAKSTCRELTIQPNSQNQFDTLYIGDEAMTGTDFGMIRFVGPPNEVAHYRSDQNNIAMNEMYLRTDAPGLQVAIQFVYD